MGLGIATVKLNLELWQRGFFKNIKSVMEMGSQELHLKKVDFNNLLEEYCLNKDGKQFPNLENWPGSPRCSAKALYELLGTEKYSSFDLNAEHGALTQDLNLPFEDRSFFEKYDLVTDYGCNEHVFNIAETYKTMHKLCKPGGVLVIDQGVWKGNGYYQFDLSFFEGLAAANNYRILFASYIILCGTTKAGSSLEYHVPLSRELLKVIDWAKVENIRICYVFQKQDNKDFQYPYQGGYMSEVFGNYGYKLQFQNSPPSRTYVPLRESALEITRTKDIFKYLLKRILRSLKRKFVRGN